MHCIRLYLLLTFEFLFEFEIPTFHRLWIRLLFTLKIERVSYKLHRHIRRKHSPFLSTLNWFITWMTTCQTYISFLSWRTKSPANRCSMFFSFVFHYQKLVSFNGNASSMYNIILHWYNIFDLCKNGILFYCRIMDCMK